MCRYCGSSAPDVKLTIDHVVPTAVGGTDEPAKLVAACADCNAGKATTSPDSNLVEDVSEDAVRWSQAMTRAAEHQRRQSEELEKFRTWVRLGWQHEFVGEYDISHEPDTGWHFKDDPDRKYAWAVYNTIKNGWDKPVRVFETEDEAEKWVDQRMRAVPFLPDDWDASHHIWIAAGIDYDDIDNGIAVAAKAGHVNYDRLYRYFCGVIWRMIEERQEIAESLLVVEDGEA